MSSKIHLSTTLTCHQIFGNFNQICLSQENPFNLIERHIFATQDSVNVQKPYAPKQPSPRYLQRTVLGSHSFWLVDLAGKYSHLDANQHLARERGIARVPGESPLQPAMQIGATFRKPRASFCSGNRRVFQPLYYPGSRSLLHIHPVVSNLKVISILQWESGSIQRWSQAALVIFNCFHLA